MRRFSLLVATAACLGTIAVGQSAIIDLAVDDPAIVAAEAQAQASLPKFLIEVVGPDGYALQTTALKVAFDTVNPEEAGMVSEAIWVSPWGMSQGQFRGLLANEPLALGDLKAGDVVDFTQDQISDWSFVGDDGKLYGNYTTRVIVTQMPPDDAAPIIQMLSAEPVPANWQN